MILATTSLGEEFETEKVRSDEYKTLFALHPKGNWIQVKKIEEQ